MNGTEDFLDSFYSSLKIFVWIILTFSIALNIALVQMSSYSKDQLDLYKESCVLQEKVED